MPTASAADIGQFRPAPLLPPKLGASFSDYETYVASYQLYLSTLSSLRHEFWDSVAKKRVGEHTISTVQVKKEFENGVKSYYIRPSKESQINFHTRGPFKDENAVYQSFKSQAGLNPRMDGQSVKQIFLKHHSIDVNEVGLRPSIVTSVVKSTVVKPITKPQPVPASAPKKPKTARNRRQRAARALRKRLADTVAAKQRADRANAILASAKASAKLDGWTVVQNRKRQRKAARSSKPVTGDTKSSPT